MVRLLVTGARGMLGAEVVSAFQGSADVTGTDIQEFDISDAPSTQKVVEGIAPDVIVNCAAYTDVDGAEADRGLAFAVNSRGAGNIARSARAVGALLVHMSTDYVFDGRKAEPYSESDDPNPINVYGESKLAGEREVEAVGVPHLIVRTSWLYGHGGRNFVDTVLRLAAERDRLQVVDDQVGAPTNARDLAGIVKELVRTRAQGIVHATNAGRCSWYEFAGAILTVAGIDGVKVDAVDSTAFVRPARRPANSVLRLDRLVSLIGWVPRHWREALEEHLAER